MAEAYPLDWPEGWPRTKREARRNANFGVFKEEKWKYSEGTYRSRKKLTLTEASNRLLKEINLIADRSEFVLSMNVRVRKDDGMPYANTREPEDPGAAVYFHLKGEHTVIACDAFDRLADNICAIAKTLSSMRAIERYGCSELMKRAFMGFQALPAGNGAMVESWQTILGIPADEDIDDDTLRHYFREAAKTAHPDLGGSVERFTNVKNAYEDARRALGFE